MRLLTGFLSLLICVVPPLAADCVVGRFGGSVASIASPKPMKSNPTAEVVSLAGPNGFAIGFDFTNQVPLNVTPFNQILSGCQTPAAAPGGGQTVPAPAAARVPALTAAQQMAVGDLNGDGIPDVVAIGTSGNIAVFVSNSDGSFSPETDFPTAANPRTVVLVDVNGDGNLDAIVANAGDASKKDAGSVSVLFGNGDGTFLRAVNYAAGSGPSSVVVGDFNGDKIPDLAVANSGQGTAGNVSILLGAGGGAFRAAVNFTAGTTPTSILAADFNGDGIADLAVANLQSGDISILIGSGSGTFQRTLQLAASDSPSFLGVADMNQDGFPDLVALSASDSVISVFAGDGKGGFQKTGGYLGAQSPNTFQFVSWRANGFVDLLTAGPSNFFLYQSNGDGTLAAAPSYFVGVSAQSVAVADLNQDGNQDVVVVSSASLAILQGKGNGTFQSPVRLNIATPDDGNVPDLTFVALADLNHDGIIDMAVADAGNGLTHVLFGRGDGSFQPQGDFGVGAHPIYIAVADFNGDGNPDLAVADADGVIWILPGAGNGSFTNPTGYRAGNPLWVGTGDFNGDGRTDLLVVNSSLDQGGVGVYLGNGDSTFRPPVAYAAGTFPQSAAIGDFNGDGKLDVAVLTSDKNNAYSIVMLLGTGTGTFQPGPSTPTGASGAFLVARDFDGDGKLDLAVSHNAQGGDLTILTGNGDGTFNPEIHVAAGIAPNAIAIGDFNGDGKPDIAVTGGFDESLGILEILLNNPGPTPAP